MWKNYEYNFMHLNFSLFNKVWDMVISTSSLHEYLMGLHFYVSMKLLFRIVYVFRINYFSEQILLQRSFFIHFRWLSEMQKLLNSVYKIYLWIQVETLQCPLFIIWNVKFRSGPCWASHALQNGSFIEMYWTFYTLCVSR